MKIAHLTQDKDVRPSFAFALKGNEILSISLNRGIHFLP